MQRWLRAGIAAGAVLVSAMGCTLPDFLHPRRPTPSPAATPAAVADDFQVSAVPAYRLVTSPGLADLPSRLFVVRLHLSGIEAGALSVTLDDMQVVLPSGEHGRVFDRRRAAQLLHRMTLADADLSYLQRSGHPPGGLDDAARLQLTDMIESNLVTDGVFTADFPLEGFVIVDTDALLPSLDGVSFAVTAYRLGEATAARGTYRFAAAPPATEAP